MGLGTASQPLTAVHNEGPAHAPEGTTPGRLPAVCDT